MTSHTHVQLSNSKAYITIRNAKAVKDTHTVTHSHTHSSYEQQSALTSHFSHCQDWKYQLLTLRRNSPNTPQPHPGFQEEQRRTQASDQWSWLECVQRRSVEVHKLGRRRATNSLSNVSAVQCSAVQCFQSPNCSTASLVAFTRLWTAGSSCKTESCSRPGPFFRTLSIGTKFDSGNRLLRDANH